MANLALHLQYGTPAFAEYRAQVRETAANWARRTLAIPPANWRILDTETTGLGEDAEIVQVGLIDGAGQALMDNALCKPLAPIPPEATAVHQITNQMVADAPSFYEVFRELTRQTEERVVLIYNKAYDLRLIRQSLALAGIALPYAPARVECVMLRYADFLGEWNERYRNFKWPKLAGGDHSAVGDCLATLEVIREMAEG